MGEDPAEPRVALGRWQRPDEGALVRDERIGQPETARVRQRARRHPAGHDGDRDAPPAGGRDRGNRPIAERQVRRYLYRCPRCARDFPRARPLRRTSACLACCREFNRRRYDRRFRLQLVSR